MWNTSSLKHNVNSYLTNVNEELESKISNYWSGLRSLLNNTSLVRAEPTVANFTQKNVDKLTYDSTHGDVWNKTDTSFLFDVMYNNKSMREEESKNFAHRHTLNQCKEWFNFLTHLMEKNSYSEPQNEHTTTTPHNNNHIVFDNHTGQRMQGSYIKDYSLNSLDHRIVYPINSHEMNPYPLVSRNHSPTISNIVHPKNIKPANEVAEYSRGEEYDPFKLKEQNKRNEVWSQVSYSEPSLSGHVVIDGFSNGMQFAENTLLPYFDSGTTSQATLSRKRKFANDDILYNYQLNPIKRRRITPPSSTSFTESSMQAFSLKEVQDRSTDMVFPLNKIQFSSELDNTAKKKSSHRSDIPFGFHSTFQNEKSIARSHIFEHHGYDPFEHLEDMSRTQEWQNYVFPSTLD
eukprot:TRINITY_DN7639_c0_g1_i1.p1 TRINITY_DN7639_c0_g1~~TRINITY_DN7639_c0_g1_i1.p1  ORF type:complete len:403 (-),score=38.44 TRINITY_DN7639_c0_g1_i1:39-1247(-)